jgi:hypothetical protein
MFRRLHIWGKDKCNEWSAEETSLGCPGSIGTFCMSVRGAEQQHYRSDGRFWPVVLCCAVVRRKSVSMRTDTILH